MDVLKELTAGYQEFLRQTDPKTQKQYKVLAQKGQSPKIMVIGCCDSRVSPSLIFNEEPGSVFTVRNVANLVPPFEHDNAFHGTSAALEYAVSHLHVEHIVVMGHSGCGGIAASLDHVMQPEQSAASYFIQNWVAMIDKVAADVVADHPDAQRDSLLPEVEKRSIQQSLDNLETFPFISQAVMNGRLGLHGLYFDIASGALYALDKTSGEFVKLGAMED